MDCIQSTYISFSSTGAFNSLTVVTAHMFIMNAMITVITWQLGKFRELLNKSGHSVADNFRPVQQMNGRLLWKNFEN